MQAFPSSSSRHSSLSTRIVTKCFAHSMKMIAAYLKIFEPYPASSGSR